MNDEKDRMKKDEVSLIGLLGMGILLAPLILAAAIVASYAFNNYV